MSEEKNWQFELEEYIKQGEPGQIGKSFIKSYYAVCLEGAIILLACIIFSICTGYEG